MILIFSIPYEVSTDEVTKWIKKLGGEFIRINQLNPDEITNLSIKIDGQSASFQLYHDGLTISDQDIGSVWYRRSSYFHPFDFNEIQNKLLIPAIQDVHYSESRSLLRGVYSLLQDRFWLSDPMSSSVIKLNALDVARKNGLKIPITHVVTRKADIEKIIKEYDCITKPIYEITNIISGKESFTPWTRKLSTADLTDLPDIIYPCLVQEYIPKKFEIRAFYLDEELYAMAMFSQNDKSTEVDFRAGGPANYTRKVPYELPTFVKEAIIGFMKQMDLNTGSLDLIYSQDEEFYFLEVNPVGQFGMTSRPCNYNLEKKIAEILVAKDKKFQDRNN